MKLYFAPMEGITTWYYRNLHHEFFPGIDRYYTPFLSANQNLTFQSREQADVDPANNEGIPVVPQLMTNKAGEFLWGARSLRERGYTEVNLNLGCPASQVVNRRKGAGFLEDPARLDRFFEETYDGMEKMRDDFRVSVKTRIGYHSEAEAEQLLTIYNRYPLAEVIIHPRTLREYYRGTPHRDIFQMMLEGSRHPVCYNGDINTVSDYEELLREFPAERYPQFEAVMFGRGLIADPALVREIRSREGAPLTNTDISEGAGAGLTGREIRSKAGACLTDGAVRNGAGAFLTDTECRKFTAALLKMYAENVSGGDKNVLNKMKEIWTHLGTSFEGKDGKAGTAQKALKEIHKSRTLSEYKLAVENFYAACSVRRTAD